MTFQSALEIAQLTANIATVISAVVVALSVVLISRQLKQQSAQLEQQTEWTKSANTQALVDLSSPFNMQLIQDRQMAELWVEGPKKFDTYDRVDQERYKVC